jgi:hypothetical protein
MKTDVDEYVAGWRWFPKGFLVSTDEIPFLRWEEASLKGNLFQLLDIDCVSEYLDGILESFEIGEWMETESWKIAFILLKSFSPGSFPNRMWSKRLEWINVSNSRCPIAPLLTTFTISPNWHCWCHDRCPWMTYLPADRVRTVIAGFDCT